MGYMFVVGSCYGCGKLFSFNADYVPSFNSNPICETCIALVNDKRKEGGLPEWPVHPDAYEPQEVA